MPLRLLAHDVDLALNVGALFRIADALGRETEVVYDSWSGNPASVIVDAGAGHFNARTTPAVSDRGCRPGQAISFDPEYPLDRYQRVEMG